MNKQVYRNTFNINLLLTQNQDSKEISLDRGIFLGFFAKIISNPYGKPFI